jgi:hypothetical protein
MTKPSRTTSAVMPVRLREDLPREVATAYWAEQHAAIVKRLPNLVEYTQHHFSPTDHGYWPASDRVGTLTPSSWRFDGLAETRFTGMVGSLRILPRIKDVWYDEHNVFEQVLGNLTGPRGGRWWTPGFDVGVGHRTALFVRRRSGVSGRAFRAFVRGRLAPALLAAGGRDLRAYTFMPYSPLSYPTPGVSHDNPPHRRYHGVVMVGAGTRAAMDALLGSAQISAFVAQQHEAFAAVHAYAVARSVPVVGTRSPSQR